MKGWITSVRLVSEFDASFLYITAKITLARIHARVFIYLILIILPAWGIKPGF